MKTIQRFALTLLSTLIILSATACAPDKLSISSSENSILETTIVQSETRGAAEEKTSKTSPTEDEEKKADTSDSAKAEAKARFEAVKKQRERVQKRREKRQKKSEERQQLKKTVKAIKGKSLGKLYPKNTLTWRGVTLSFLPCPEARKVIDEYESLGKNSYDSGYILELNSSFKRNDGKNSSYGAHNQTPGFEPFNQMQIGDHVYVTGDKGTTFDYIVVDNIELHHKGIHDLTSTGGVKMIKRESANENFPKLTGSHYPDPESFDFLEYISLSWCRDDYIMECFVAVPIEHYHFYVEEGIIYPVD